MSFDYAAQPKETLTACNLCGGQQSAPFADKDRYNLPVTSVMCKDCGLVYLNPRMTRDAYREFYQGAYRDLLSAHYGRDVKAMVSPTQDAYGHWLAWWLTPHLGVISGTLLDIGGSEGRVSEILAQRYRIEPTVLEPSDEEGAKARAKGFEVILGSLEDWDPKGRQFDVVLLCQTVDHLLDVAGSMGKIRALLRPGGLFFVDISDFRYHLYRNGRQDRVIKVDHPFYLTPITMGEYLKQAGFRIINRMGGWLQYQSAFVCEVPQ